MNRKMTLTEKIMRDAELTDEITALLTPVPTDAPTPWYEDPNKFSLELIQESAMNSGRSCFLPIELLRTSDGNKSSGLWLSNALAYNFTIVGSNDRYTIPVKKLKQLLLDDETFTKVRSDVDSGSSLYTLLDLRMLVEEGLAKRVNR